MTKILRRRFIFFAMFAVTMLLLFLVAAISGLTLIVFDQQSDAVLDKLVQADGMFKRMEFQNDQPHGKRPPLGPPPDMDLMRSFRFFTVHTDGQGNVVKVNIDEISSVTEDTAASYTEAVAERGKTRGKLYQYKYAVKETEEGPLIIFLDISRQTSIFRTVLTVSSCIALISWLAVLAVVVPVSGKVVRPIIANMEKQKQFITDAGHELKTPLAIIQSNNDAMTLIHGENKYNTNIRTQTHRLNELMSNLLAMAKLDEEMLMPLENVDVSALTEEFLPSYKDSALNRNITFAEKVTPGIRIQTNRDAFSQLLGILLDNALKYTPEGGVISFSLSKQGSQVLIEEENNCDPEGKASDPEQLFERFYRGDGARTQPGADSGYGIGLSIARKICENFGGILKAEYPAEDRIRFTAKF